MAEFVLTVRLWQRIAPALCFFLTYALFAAGCSSVSTSNGPTDPPPALTLGTTSLPDAQLGVPYSATLTATGGTPAYTWALTGGTLPAGLAFNTATGTISGTPTSSSAAVALTFTVTDSGSPAQSASRTLSLVVSAPAPVDLTITTVSLPGAQLGQPYALSLGAAGGTTPYSWSLTGGTLPAGLSLNAASGLISGTPTATSNGTALTFKVSDASTPTQSASKSLTLVIAAATSTLTITTTSLPTGRLGTSYSATLAASGGTTPYTWTLSGTLPAGLSFNGTTGTISGTPTASAAATPLQFTVKDSSNPVQSQTATFTLTINSGAISVSVSPARAALTITQTLPLTATTSDSAGVKWSISPAGGSFSSATSTSGTKVTFTAPATAGIYTVTATSVSDPSATASLTVGVTDLTGVYTYHNDVARDGANTQEYALNLTNVNSATFGKLSPAASTGRFMRSRCGSRTRRSAARAIT